VVVDYVRLLLFYILLLDPTPPSEIHTLSLHDALPISCTSGGGTTSTRATRRGAWPRRATSGSRSTCTARAKSPPIRRTRRRSRRSEEHTSELQSHLNLVCRLLLEKKKQQ